MRGFKLKLVGLVVGLIGLAPVPVAAHGPPGYYMHETVNSWNGLYLGAAIGYGFSSTNLTHDWIDIGPVDVRDRYTIDQDSLHATFSVGFDREIAGQFVLGAFADYSHGSIRDRVTLATPGNVGLRLTLDDSWAVGGRLGVIHRGGLWYFSTGYTAIDVSFAGFSETLHGYFLGGGIEKDIGYNFRMKLEYRFSDYARQNFFSNVAESVDIDTETHSFRLGLSYLLGHRQSRQHEPLK